MTTSKQLLFIGVILFLCVVIALTTAYFLIYSGTHAYDIDAIYDPQLQQTAYRRNCISITQDGTAYASSNLFLHYESEDGERIIDMAPRHMSFGTHGIAYRNSALYYVQDGNKTLVAENDCAYTMDGDRVIYFDESNSTVYAWKNGYGEALFSVDDKRGYAILANQKWIVLIADDLYVYEKDTSLLTSIDSQLGAYTDPCFIYGDWIITLRGGGGGSVAIYLPDFSSVELDFGWSTQECINKLAVASDGTFLYVSLNSTVFPTYDDEVFTGTRRLDPATWDIEVIDDQFYPSLLCSRDGILYGNKCYSIRMDQIVDLNEFNVESLQ